MGHFVARWIFWPSRLELDFYFTRLVLDDGVFFWTCAGAPGAERFSHRRERRSLEPVSWPACGVPGAKPFYSGVNRYRRVRIPTGPRGADGPELSFSLFSLRAVTHVVSMAPCLLLHFFSLERGAGPRGLDEPVLGFPCVSLEKG